MNKFSIAFVGLFASLLAVLPSVGMASPAMTPLPSLAKPLAMQPFTPTQPLTVLPIAEQLGQQLQSIVAPPPAATTPDEGDQEPPPTFGTRALNAVINITEILRGETQHFATDFGALPQLSNWYIQQTNDAHLAARWQATGNDLISTAGIAFLGALVLEVCLYPLRRVLRLRQPRSFTARLAAVLGLFCLRALPIILFVAASVTLLNQYETQKFPRFLILNFVYAIALAGTVISFLRGVFSPRADALRFIPATTAQAVYGFRWLRAFTLLIVGGYFCAEVARAAHIPEAVVAAFINALGLVLVIMGIVVIVQKRAFVAQLLRGDLSVAQHDLSWFESLRLWFARQWHRLAIAYLIIGYAIAALGVQDGLVIMLRGTLVTLLVMVAARLLLREISLWEMRQKKNSATFYTLMKGVVLRLLVAGLTVTGFLLAWGVDLSAVAASPLGHRLLGSAFSIGLTFLILGLSYEFFSGAVDRQLAPQLPDGSIREINARSRTLLPMMRNAVFVLFLAIVGVVVLSEAGINIGPLIAGAGVLGVAVGFGSQTLVKDFLTGLFIVLENAIAVGDVIKVGDHNGVVEAMSMRTMRLRDMDGAVHILPFSEVSQIINQTKGFSHAVIKFNVSHDANLDAAMNSIRATGEEMEHDSALQNIVLEPVEILGVDSINDASITIMARVRTAPGHQWDVKRLFLLRLKQRFDKDGIQFANSTTVMLKQ